MNKLTISSSSDMMIYTGYIYAITNKINGKVYIGQAIDYERRFKDHRRNWGSNQHLQNSFKKYGKESFVFEIIEEVQGTPEELTEREQWWVDSFPHEQLYNFLKYCVTSFKGCHHSLKTRRRLSEIQKQRFGEKHPNCKKVFQLNKNNTIIKMWPYVKKAAEVLNLQASHITKCCKGKRKYHGNYKWQYAS